MIIYISNQVFFEICRKIFYRNWKYISNNVYHTSIDPHLTRSFKGFVVKSQIFNLTCTFFFYHNSCILGLNEQCKGTLSIYASRNGIMGAQFGVCLLFQLRFGTFATFTWVQLPKWECTWESLGFIPCILPQLWECISHLNTLLASWALTL
jgi:hypothetical protein